MGEQANLEIMDKLTVSSPERNFIESDHSTNEIQDEYILASIFPPEVWSIILLDKVGADPKNGADNLTTCIMASSYFQNLLAGRRKFLLFPKVLKILATWLEDQETRTGNNDNRISSGNMTEKADSQSTFKLTDILICREVCHQWKNIFDEFYQNPQRFSRMHHEENKLSRKLCEINMHFESPDDEEGMPVEVTLNRYRQPSMFLDHFANTHGGPSNKGNPFPARALTFGDAHFMDPDLLEPVYDIFYQGVSQIVSIYGEYLWHCDMKISDLSFGNRISFYYKLKTWLSRMPNLKTLKIECEHVFESGEVWSRTELMDDMQRRIYFSPLKEIRNLQYLQVQNLTHVVFNEIIRTSGKGITKLDIIREHLPAREVDYNIYSEKNSLPQLKELSINFCSVEHFKQMENSPVATNWKLEAFHFLYDKDAKFVEWSRVFNMISGKWAGTITNLTLKMPVFETDAERELGLKVTLSRTALQLPFLKRVKLEIRDPCSIDFLLSSMNTLESMEIHINYNVDKEKGKRYYQLLEQRQCVKFLGFEKRKQSFGRNMLEKFPKLNFLKKCPLLKQGELDEDFMTGFSVYEADLVNMKVRQ